MQQQNAPYGGPRGQVKCPVPVGFATLRVGGAARAVAHECVGWPGPGARIDLLFELREQPILQSPVVFKAADVIGLVRRELRRERLRMPELQRPLGARQEKVQRSRTHHEGRATDKQERELGDGGE